MSNIFSGGIVVFKKNAIVLAMFGTSVESGLKGIFNVYERVQEAYPACKVMLSFTSNFLRKTWQKRSVDPAYLLDHREIPEEILYIQGPLAVIAGLQEMEYRNIVVQAVHIAPGEEFLDLSSYVDALASIRTVKQKYRPFENLVVGRPAFGALVSDRYSYRQDVMIMAQALKEDADMALNEEAALVYLGHGNDTISTSGYYLELEARMTDLYSELQVCFGSLAGFPSQQEVLQQLKRAGVRKVLLKPFMLVAGMHAVKDMVGREKFSWKTMFEEQGMEVLPVLAGLGEQNAVARIFISHIEDAAKDAGIAL